MAHRSTVLAHFLIPRIIAALAVVFPLTGTAAGAFAAPGLSSSLATPPGISTGDHDALVRGGSGDNVALITAGLDRFAEVGLTLPRLEITIHDVATDDACRGHNAYWRPGDDRDRIDFCAINEFLVLHELAHAWEHHRVTDDVRDAFMARYPNDEWRQDGQHHHQGIERFADAVAWGLLASRIDLDAVDTALRRNTLASRAAIFELVTGVESPRLSA